MLPKGIVASGFPAVRDTCRQIRLEFDPWQQDAARCILGKTADGLYAADTVVLSIPRQVGKTFLVGAIVFADCIINPGTTVIWTAHRFKVARETFIELRGLATRREMAPHVDPDEIYSAAGNESIVFRNGSRIVFAARERGAVRGFSKVRRIVLDEAQILSPAAMADFAPTMNQAANPQVILMGTPPKPTDPGEVFTQLRAEALAGDSEGLLLIEFSASPGSKPDDREAWKVANPSYPSRTPARSLLRLKKLLLPEDFMREVMGMWDEVGDAPGDAIDLAAWLELTDGQSSADRIDTFAIETAPDRSWTSISAVGTRSDGLRHVELVERRRGVAWAVPRCVELDKAHGPVPWVVDGGGPAHDLIVPLQEEGLEVITAGTRDVADAYARIVDLTEQRAYRHGPQQDLLDAVKVAKKRPCGDGGSAFGRRVSGADISPIVTASLALWAADLVTSDDILW